VFFFSFSSLQTLITKKKSESSKVKKKKMNDKVNTPQMTKKRKRETFVQNLTDFSHTRRTHPTIPAEAKKPPKKQKKLFSFCTKM